MKLMASSRLGDFLVKIKILTGASRHIRHYDVQLHIAMSGYDPLNQQAKYLSANLTWLYESIGNEIITVIGKTRSRCEGAVMLRASANSSMRTLL